MQSKTAFNKKSGFTLVEIMIVVFIIVLIGAFAIPAFAKVRLNSVVTAFSSDLKKLVYAGEMYILETGYYPPDTDPGDFDIELEGYISEKFFEMTTSMGGNWDFSWDVPDGPWSAAGVSGGTMGDREFLLVDQILDDGNLSSGDFQKLSNGNYYFIIEE